MGLIWTGLDGEISSDEDLAVLHKAFWEAGSTGAQVLASMVGQFADANSDEKPFLDMVRAALAERFSQVVDAFVEFYRIAPEKRSDFHDFAARMLRGAVILCKPEAVSYVREQRRPDVYWTMWDLLVMENLRLMLCGYSRVWKSMQEFRKRLDGLDGVLFRGRFEAEWQRTMDFRDTGYGFLVQPRIGLPHMLCYLELKRGNTLIRRQISDYLVHLCRERPFLLEAVAPLFKEKAFRQRVKTAYQPLIDKTASDVFRRGDVNQAEVRGEYGRQIRVLVEDAFDQFLLDFDYHFKQRPPEVALPRWFGMLGGLSDEARQLVASSAMLGDLPLDWDREITFSHYIQQKLGKLVRDLVGDQFCSDEERLPDESVLRADHTGGAQPGDESAEAFIEDTQRTGKGQPRKRERESPEPDMNGFLKIREMAQLASDAVGYRVTAWQLREWARKGLVPTERSQSFSKTQLPRRRDYWLFRPDEETLRAIAGSANGVTQV